MRLKKGYTGKKNYAITPRYGMTVTHYNALRSMLTGIEKPGGLSKKRVRVYFEGERTTLKWYLRKYFQNYFHDIDDDAGRVVFICDSENTRDVFAQILINMKDDVPYDVPVVDDSPDGGGDDPPPPPPPDGGGDGDGPGGDDPNQTSFIPFIVVGAIAIAVIFIVIKKFN